MRALRIPASFPQTICDRGNRGGGGVSHVDQEKSSFRDNALFLVSECFLSRSAECGDHKLLASLRI
jgi:hypothetical protein